MDTNRFAVAPHRTGAFTRGHTGHLCLSIANVSVDAVTHVADYTANGAIDASGAEQWMTTLKFGPFYHSQRWRFAP